MSKITPELLRQMVGVKRGRKLCDELVGPLNLVLPAYGITTEYRIAGFLATAAPESDWFKTLREYGKGAGRAYGRAIRGLVYYGRGIFQVTWLKNYRRFTEYVAENWETIKHRAAVYKWTVPPDFVAEPELLATPYWAVEAACWYWKENGLQRYADKGLAGFFGLQGLVNRGRADRRALGYDDRLHSYETARRILADDFDLSTGAITDTETPAAAETTAGRALPAGGGNDVAFDPNGDPSVTGQPPVLTAGEPKPSFWERLTNWQGRLDTASSFKNSLNPFTPSLSPISGTSWMATATTKLGGWAMMIFGLFWNKWALFAGVALVGFALAYLAIAKRNAAKRAGVIEAPVQQTNVEVKTK